MVLALILWMGGIWGFGGIWLAGEVQAQRRYTTTRPKERSGAETVRVKTKSRQADARGVLVVLVEPILPGEIVIRSADGRDLARASADQENGQAEFALPRGRSYLIEVNHPGYATATLKSRPLAGQTVARVRLNAQSASLRLRDLPAGAQILVDDQPAVMVDGSGTAVVAGILPGQHRLRITHPEYNDFTDSFEVLDAGEEVSFGKIPLTRVARLEISGPAGALILIDGALQGKINESGRLAIDYELEQPAERVITAELTGYQTWTSRVNLSPGKRTVLVEMSPVITSAGVTDFFDSLTQWQAPEEWRVTGDSRNKRLEVQGANPGILKDRIYRDFQANFSLWLDDNRGASWALKIDPEGRHYYLFHLAGPAATGVTPRRFYTYLVREGEPPIEVGTPVPLLTDLAPQASYTISVTVTDLTIHHTITSNDSGETNDLGVWTDTSATREKYRYGTFGFRSLHGEKFLVDDFNLEPVKKP